MNRRYLILIIILTLSIAKIGASSPITSTPNVLTVSNTIIQIGQNIVVSTIISGGSNGPYSGQFTWFNSNQINNQVVNTIVVGPNSQSVAFNPSGTLAYAIMENSPGTVNVIQVSSNTVVNTINVGSDPVGVAFNPSGTLAYVTNNGGTTVSVIQVSTNTVVNTINVGLNPAGIAFNPSGTFAYVANSGGSTISVISNLPETAVQTLSTTETNNGLLQMTINVASSNTLTFTFNGIRYTETTGSANTVYGTWSLSAFAQDNSTNIYMYGSNNIVLSNTIIIEPTPPTIELANSITSNIINLVANSASDNALITATCMSSDICKIENSNGNILATGTTTVTLPYNTLPLGYSTLYSKDITLGSVSNNVIIKRVPIISSLKYVLTNNQAKGFSANIYRC